MTEEQYKLLSAEKRDLSDGVAKLKRQLGIYGKVANGQRFPKHVLHDPAYSKMCSYRDRIFEIENELAKLKKNGVAPNKKDFKDLILKIIEEKNPELFLEAKNQAYESMKNA